MPTTGANDPSDTTLPDMLRRLGIAFLTYCLYLAAGFGAETTGKEPTSAGSYFVQYGGAGLYRMRLSDGSIHEFMMAAGSTNRFYGADKWYGSFIEGGVTLVRSAPYEDPLSRLYRFKDGRLTGTVVGKGAAKAVASGTWPKIPFIELWPPPADEKKVMEDLDTWRNARFLKLGFVNPNRCGAFLALVALALAGICASVRRRWAKAISGLCAAAVFAAVLLTHSRGAVVAFAIGLACYFLPRLFRMPRRYIVLFPVLFAVLLSVGVFLCYGRSGTPLAKSSDQRIDIWRNTPQMMVDAPEGWGFISSGRAFVDWYQPFNRNFVARTLINDHLTILVSCGWLARFGYVFLWFFALFCAFRLAKDGTTAMPLAVWAAFCVAAFFNPVMESPVLWMLPAAAGVVFVLRAKPWCEYARYGRVCALAAICALAVTSGIYAIGSVMQTQHPRVRARNGLVRINGIRPETLLVCDDVVLGNGLTEKHLRAFYAANPHAPSISYAYGIDALPRVLPRRLVLAGRTGAEFLDRWVSAPDGAKPPLPKELLFITPTFPPWAVPEQVLKSCRTRIVIGEFLASFDPGYSKPLPWVEIVAGDELYVHDWIYRTVYASGDL